MKPEPRNHEQMQRRDQVVAPPDVAELATENSLQLRLRQAFRDSGHLATPRASLQPTPGSREPDNLRRPQLSTLPSLFPALPSDLHLSEMALP